jgi:hypothetical protein
MATELNRIPFRFTYRENLDAVGLGLLPSALGPAEITLPVEDLLQMADALQGLPRAERAHGFSHFLTALARPCPQCGTAARARAWKREAEMDLMTHLRRTADGLEIALRLAAETAPASGERARCETVLTAARARLAVPAVNHG